MISNRTYAASKCISIYVSFAGEPNTLPLSQHSLQTNNVALVPHILPKNDDFPPVPLFGFMRMRRLPSLYDLNSWPLNRVGIREPPLPATGEADQEDGLNCGTLIRHGS